MPVSTYNPVFLGNGPVPGSASGPDVAAVSGGKNQNPATQTDGTENLRANPKAMQAGYPSVPSGKNQRPAVQSYKDSSV